MPQVFILQMGYGKPVGEPRSRLIQPGETIEWDGPLAFWMKELKPGEGGALDAPPEPYMPEVLKRATQRARSAMTVREMQARGTPGPAMPTNPALLAEQAKQQEQGGESAPASQPETTTAAPPRPARRSRGGGA